MDLKIYYINLDRCINRRQAIEFAFPQENLIRIQGIDGLQWSDGTVDEYSRYNWDTAAKDKFILRGVLATCETHRRPLMPMEVACNLSHVSALLTFLDTKDPAAIILEDDVEPTSYLQSHKINDLLKIPTGADMVYLCGPEHPGRRLSLYKDGQVKWARTLMAYWVTRRAAELIVQAAVPMCYLLDTQAQVRLFKSLEPYKQNWVSSELKELPRFKAFGLFKPLIQHSNYAKITTFTKDGTKRYIPKEGRIE